MAQGRGAEEDVSAKVISLLWLVKAVDTSNVHGLFYCSKPENREAKSVLKA